MGREPGPDGRLARPTWGFQIYGGAELFADPDRAGVFRDAVFEIRRRIAGNR